MAASAAQPLTVSLVTGVVVPRDAISNICREQLEAIARYGRLHRRRVDVKVYACHATYPDARIHTASDAAALAADGHFLGSDLIVYHFGIYYPLFDSIHLAPRTARTVVNYYGITGPALLPPSVRPSLYNSYRQAVNLHAADRILTTSKFLTAELAHMGVPAARVRPIPLPVSFERLPDPARRPAPGGTRRLAYVGRFVSAKGVHDLLRALALFKAQGGGPVELDLVGSAIFSDQAYLAELRAFAAAHELESLVRFHFDVPDAELAEVLLRADALVIPSYHEGFCIPVIEAMACGCFPICSDAGALPETSAGLGRTFAVGNADELAARLHELAAGFRQDTFLTDTGFVPRGEWQRRARAYSLGFAREKFQEHFWAAVLDGLTPTVEEVRPWLADARRRALEGLRHGTPAPPVSRAIQTQVELALAASAEVPGQARAG